MSWWAARCCTTAQDCIVWSERDTVVLYGVQDLVVVQANGRILVMPTERAASMKQLLDALPPDMRDLTSVTPALLLEPDLAGAGVGAVRRRPADGGAARRCLADPGALGGRARGGHDRHPGRPRRGLQRGDEPPVRDRWMPIEGPALVDASWFAPTGAPTGDRAARSADSPTAVRRWHGSCPPVSSWGAPHDHGPGARGGGRARSEAPTIWSPPSRHCSSPTAPTSGRRPPSGVPEGSVVLGDPADVVCLGALGRARRSVRRAPRRGGDRGGGRGAERNPAGGAGLRGAGHPGARRVHPGLGVRSRVPGTGRDRLQRVPRLRQQGARRVRRPQRASATGSTWAPARRPRI